MSGSFYQLNQKYNQLLALIQGLPTSFNLTQVLTAGDDAGGLDITNLNNIDLTTINGSAYPPASGNLVINDQTASYTLVATDNNKRVIMDSASATTITVDNSIFVKGDSVFVANEGTGIINFSAGAGVVVNSSAGFALEQYRSALLLALSASNFSLFLSAGLSPLIATGGTITTATISGVSYKIHTYDVIGTFSFVVSSLGNSNGEVEYLVVAGGGGGGGQHGGGGGAGGYRCSVVGETSGGGAAAEPKLTLTPSSFTVVVGDGGSGGAGGVIVNGVNGSSSSFHTISSVGGGGGASAGASGVNGSAGGSGGGGGHDGGNGGAPTANEGFAGGKGGGINGIGAVSGGGGGGAGVLGGDAPQGSSSLVGGNGGNGISSNINGTSTPRGGGGGGRGQSTFGVGGSGGGGNGTTNGGAVAGAGGSNTGGGGGGGHTVASAGGKGGSGIVIIRYPF